MPSFTRLAAFAAGAMMFAAVPVAHAAVVETVHVTVTGGAHAGTYDASTEHGGCSAGLTGPGSFGNQLSQPKEKDPKKFNALQLIIPDAKGAASGTHDFFMTVRFGSILGPNTEYEIETREGKKKSGSGSIKLTDRGATAAVDFDVKTADGVAFRGTIDCRSVVRGK